MDSIVDLFLIVTGIAIAVVAILRLASMGWNTHRRGWQIIYALLAVWGAGNVMLALTGKGHMIPLFGLAATALWFYESKDRWRTGAPEWMQLCAPARRSGDVHET